MYVCMYVCRHVYICFSSQQYYQGLTDEMSFITIKRPIEGS